MRHVLLVFIMSISIASSAQEDSVIVQNLRLIHKNQFGISLGGPGFLGYYYEHYFNHNWSLELGIGSVLLLNGAYVEGRYYVGSKNKPHKYTPYIGVGGGVALIIDGTVAPTVYAPIGFQLFNAKGLSYSLEVAYFYLDGESFPMGALRFPLVKQKKNRSRN